MKEKHRSSYVALVYYIGSLLLRCNAGVYCAEVYLGYSYDDGDSTLLMWVVVGGRDATLPSLAVVARVELSAYGGLWKREWGLIQVGQEHDMTSFSSGKMRASSTFTATTFVPLDLLVTAPYWHLSMSASFALLLHTMKKSKARRAATPKRPLERTVSVEACSSSSTDSDYFGQSLTPLAPPVAWSGRIHPTGPSNSGYIEMVTTCSRVADECFTPQERPWKHLSIRPDPADKTYCRVFEDERYIKTYKMLGCPEQWVDLVRLLWDYGNQRAMALEAMYARRRGFPHSPIAEEETVLTYAPSPEESRQPCLLSSGSSSKFPQQA